MNSVSFVQNEERKLESIISYNHKLSPIYIRDALYSIIPDGTKHINVLGIGSNMINGDSLGPFVGTLLKNLYSEHLTVIGNLEKPLDAINLVQEIPNITAPEKTFHIAVDSVLGTEKYLNSIVVRQGSLFPGEGLGHSFMPLGDCSIMGVILDKGCTDQSSLFLTNLNLIYTMATAIAKGISLAVRQYFRYPSTQPILL